MDIEKCSEIKAFKFKNYERDDMYRVTDVEVYAKNLEDAKRKVLEYYTNPEKASELALNNEVVLKYESFVPFFHGGYAFIECNEDKTTTINGEFK